MAFEAPADKSVLVIRSIETKLAMHWLSGNWPRSLERRVHASRAHEIWSCSVLRLLLGPMDFFFASISLSLYQKAVYFLVSCCLFWRCCCFFFCWLSFFFIFLDGRGDKGVGTWEWRRSSSGT